MNLARARMGKRWEEIADAAGISSALLRNIRKDRAPLTLDSKLAIERAYDWPDGTVDAILRNDVGVIRQLKEPPARRAAPADDDLYARVLRDEVEEAMMAIDEEPEEKRWRFIFARREREARKMKRRLRRTS
ncbi:hypothetical protein [Prauserella flavalba]|uniref:Uncharacterized protein n=1 Tax=Prauserella flavalba TaxID=1477506 RepID=A0A318LX35_9PSEU|nr:hypothetical protein [Prauserella flavalba]PXY16503.1 hypothetical protein BA062_38765 [Prauserella flavalba]